MNPLTQALISGVTVGAVYALLGIGMVIVYQTAHVTNIAHGESYAISAIVVAALVATQSVPIWAAIVIGMLAACLCSLALEWFILRPRQSWSHFSLILVTIAAALFVRGVLHALIGSDPVSFPRLISGPPIRFLGGVLSLQGLLVILVGFGAALAIPPFLSGTRLGRQLRAAAENPDAAQLMGVNVNLARSIAFAIAGAYGALGAVLFVPLVSVEFNTGLSMTMRGFIVAALAGMSPLLVVVCGLGLGLGEALVTAYFDALAKDPVVFLVLIGVAVWRSRHVRFGGGRRA
jgi:branched-chain amino acid transport system permease protein